ASSTTTRSISAERLRGFDAADIEDRRHEIDRVVVLLANLASGLDSCRPRDDARVRRAAVELVALPHLKWRVERHRPPVRIMAVGLLSAVLIQSREVLLLRVRHPVHH